MVIKHSPLEYIRINGFSRISSMLAQTAEGFKRSSEDAFAARDLHKDKIVEIAKAREIVNSILQDSAELQRFLMKEPLRHELQVARPRTERAKTIAPKAKRVAAPRSVTKQDYVAGSQKALENLQKNIRELKEHLGV